MIKKYTEFLNESQNHPLQGRIPVKYDPDSEEFLKEFQELFQEKHARYGSLNVLNTFNDNTTVPTIIFNPTPGKALCLKDENRLDNRSTMGYILYLIDGDYFGYEEEAMQHQKTMKSYIVDVPEEVQKFCNIRGYKVCYTYIILKAYGNLTELLVTFVKDPELVKKHRGSIAGRKFNL
jgi:hypothetical protein